MHPSEGRPGERWSGGSAVRARHSRKESINSQRSATSETAALRDRAVLEFHPLEKNVIAQCSDSGGWTSRRRSRAGRRQRVRGLGGGACAGTLRLAVPGARSPSPPGHRAPSPDPQGAGLPGFFTASASALGGEERRGAQVGREGGI